MRKFEHVLCYTRSLIGISQDEMADRIGVSRRTIQNWESGASAPTVYQAADWFRACGVNPFQYCFEIFHPESFEKLSPQADDKVIEDALLEIISDMSPRDKRMLFYILYGSHGSDRTSVLNLILADMHTPMISRVGIAISIISNYEIAELQGRIVDADKILPDIDRIKKAAELCKSAAIEGKSAYMHESV